MNRWEMFHLFFLIRFPRITKKTKNSNLEWPGKWGSLHYYSIFIFKNLIPIITNHTNQSVLPINPAISQTGKPLITVANNPYSSFVKTISQFPLKLSACEG